MADTRATPEAVMERLTAMAEDVLFPAAIETERSDLIPVELLDTLADAGFYGLAGPPDVGGAALPMDLAARSIEIMAGACLSTTFVWVQHHGVVLSVAFTAPPPLREQFLARLCAGDVRAGIALAGALSGPVPMLRARRVEGGWALDGMSPWVTGWGLVDVLMVAARDDQDDLVWLLIDAESSPTLRVEQRPMVALNATGTVALHVEGHLVPDERLIRTEPYAGFPERDAQGLRLNGSLSLGVAGRCCDLIGPSPLDAELAACRDALDRSPTEQMPAARAAATELAGRASHTLIVAEGSSSILADHHGQRLAREALFLLVFGSRPLIRASLLDRLGAPPAG